MVEEISRCKTCWHREGNHTGASKLKKTEYPQRKFTTTACSASSCTCLRYKNDADRPKAKAKPKAKAENVSTVTKSA